MSLENSKLDGWVESPSGLIVGAVFRTRDKTAPRSRVPDLMLDAQDRMTRAELEAKAEKVLPAKYAGRVPSDALQRPEQPPPPPPANP